MEKKDPSSPRLHTSSFYSSKTSKSSKTWLEKQAKWQAKCEEYKKKPIPIPRLLRLDDPIPVFKRFPTQQLAFDFAKSNNKDVHIFSEEIDSEGKRRYLVSTFDEFWQFYRKLKLENRHYYEVIIEGSACKLYFDLEFKKEFNKENNGVEMLDIWIKYVCSQIKQHFAIICNRKHIIDMDSSTDNKFSRHLIFCLPGAVFKDNIHVGNFVNHICASLLNYVHNCAEDSQDTDGPEPKLLKMTGKHTPDVSVQDLKKLLIKNSKGEISTFCDQGVYTKNRNFRFFKSTKFGKNASLEISQENKYKPDVNNRKGSFSRDYNYLLFLDSLICNVSHSDSNNHDVKILTFECESQKLGKRTRSQGSTSMSGCQDSTASGYQQSPYPQIDRFITSVVNKGGVQGKRRRWAYFSQGKILMFDIEKNRWCENIGRQHKSNHIIMVADMKQGVYYQKCHDPECRNFKSQEKLIPDEINPLKQPNILDDSGVWEDEELDDDVLCQVATEVETNEQLAKQQLQTNDDENQEIEQSIADYQQRKAPQSFDNDQYTQEVNIVNNHENQISFDEKDSKPKEDQYLHISDINEQDEQFEIFLQEDETWEPWKDLPMCNNQSSC